MVIAEGLVLVTIILAIIGGLVWISSVLVKPSRQDAKDHKIASKVNKNHQDFFVLVTELVALDSINPIFPEEELTKAKKILADYREETTL